MAEGVDVSRWQGHIDWRAARSGGIEFAYIKATEGIGYVDPEVDRHLTGARSAGVVPGLYHFARPDTNTGRQDAEHFAAEVNARSAAGPGNLPPCLDLEELRPGGFAGLNLVNWVSEFLAVARALTGRRQFILYGSASFLRDRLGGLNWLDNDCLVWVAHYGRSAGSAGFKDHRTVMHQYTDTGRIPGYSADIDRNYCWVDLATLTGGGGVPTPPPPPTPPSGGGGGEYVVRAGQTLSGIAAEIGFPGGWQALYELNRDRIGSNPNMIQVGTRLRTSGSAPARGEIEIRPGDSLASIAQREGIAGGWEALYNANRDRIGPDPDLIFPGRKLRRP